jgi:hypothetical protein
MKSGVLRINFKPSLSSSLTSADLMLTTNSTDFSALLTTEITLAAYILNLEFTTTQESPVSVEVVVNKPVQSGRTVSQVSTQQSCISKGQLHLRPH